MSAKGRVNTGFSERLIAAFIQKGYVRADGKPDIRRFAIEKGYVTGDLYRWKGGVIPRADMAIRLARDLDQDLEWLVFGRSPPAAPKD